MKSIFDLLQAPQIVTNDRNPKDALIKDFVDAINAERERRGFKYKKGEKWIREKPVTFMAVKMKLYAIRDDEQKLQAFLSECKYSARKYGSFSKCFFGATSTKK